MKNVCYSKPCGNLRVSVVFLCFVAAAAVHAGTFSITDPSPVTEAFSADGAAVITTIPITQLSASAFNKGLVQSEYPSWTINTGAASPGSFSVSRYAAGSAGVLGGAEMRATYDNGSPVTTGQTLRWVQFVSCNVLLGSEPNPCIDPTPNDDTLPFYWTNAELPSYTSGNSLTFRDYPTRYLSSLSTTDPIEWRGNLFLVEWDGAKTVTARDGLQWGWDMKSATKGSASGKFVNPSPAGPPAVLTGVGTPTFTWGDGSPFGSPPSSLSFAGSSFNPKPGDTFTLGTLSYFNGTTLVGTEAHGVDLSIAVAFDNVPSKSMSLDTTLELINTDNLGIDPWADADYASFTSGGYVHSFHVLEGQSAQVDLLAKIVASTVTPINKSLGPLEYIVTDITYTIDLIGFGDVVGGGLVTDVPVAIPVPGSLALAGLGAAIVTRIRSRRRVRSC